MSWKARRSEKCVFVQARAFEWVQNKVGDYGRSEETLCHPTRCPAPLFPPPPSLPCQHVHPAHTQGSCRNYGPLCFEGTLTACKNSRVYRFWKDTYTICPKYNVSRRLTAVIPECSHCEDCQYQTTDSQLVRWHPKEPN